TLVTRVSDFIAAMNDISNKATNANDQVEQRIANFEQATAQTLSSLTELANQFDVNGHSLAETVALIDNSNRVAEGSLSARRSELESLVTTLDARGGDLEERLQRFSSLLDRSLEGATERAREIARILAESTSEGARTIAENFEAIRSNTEEERRRTSELMRNVYDQATGEAQGMFSQAAERFSDVVERLKAMTSEMQKELESTRTELRKGILELPQET